MGVAVPMGVTVSMDATLAVGSLGLFLSLSRSRFVHGAHGTKVCVVWNSLWCSYNLSNLGCKVGNHLP